MNPDIPKQLQDKLMQFQNLQNQLQMLVYQKQQMTLQVNEMDNAISELEKVGKGKVYKAAGPLLIETDRATSDKELKEAKETANARLAILEKQEKKLNEKTKEMRQELESTLKGEDETAG